MNKDKFAVVAESDTTKTREDTRHEIRINKLLAEIDAVAVRVNDMIKFSYTPKFEKIPDIDRNIFIMELTALQSYHAALTAKLDWEKVRIRTSAGERLNSDFLTFWGYLFGEAKDKKCNKKCTEKCDKKCTKKCAKKCNKKCSK